MDRDALRTLLQDILRNIVADDGVAIHDESVADEVAGWDSTNHVRLIVAIEEELHIRFQADEIVAPTSVGGLLDLIEAKLKP